MRILLIRHGEAIEHGARSDSERWLTAHGRQTTRRVAAWLAEHAPPRTVLTSPLVRAAQTAEIVLSACGLDDAAVFRELATGDVAAVVERVMTFHGEGPLCLVGHEPTLSEVIARALGLDAPPRFPKSGVFALERDGHGAMTFLWRLRPKDITRATDLGHA